MRTVVSTVPAKDVAAAYPYHVVPVGPRYTSRTAGVPPVVFVVANPFSHIVDEDEIDVSAEEV